MNRVRGVLLLCAGMLAARTASAAPPKIPTAADTAWAHCGAPIALGPVDRSGLLTVPDGAGGLFAVWQELRPVSFHFDLAAQHLGADGFPIPGWPADGLGLSTEAGDQFDAVMTADGAGGFLLAWADDRADSNGHTNPDIYGLRVNAGGAVATGWTAGGTALTLSSRPQSNPAIAPDGLSGAFVAWSQPTAASPADGEIVVQHVLADGSFSPGWPDTGIVIATGTAARGSPTVVSDGAGGCIVAWYDGRNGDRDIFAQRVDALGNALWTPLGVPACVAPREQLTPRAVPDGAGGIVIAIQDLLAAQFNSVDIIAQRLDASGSRPAGWPANGVAVCRAGSAQINHRIAADGAGGAFVSWDDYRSSQSRSYAQHITGAGAVAGGWNTDGNSLGSGIEDQYETEVAADGAGGMVAAWTTISNLVVVLRLTGAGVPAGGWTSDGQTLCLSYPQTTPSLAGDGLGGVLVSRFDLRTGSGSEIVASHITQDAVVPTQVALAGIEISPGRVRLRWFGAEPGDAFTLWRRRGNQAWESRAALFADGSRLVTYEESDVRPGDRLRYRLVSADDPRTTLEVALEIPVADELALAPVSPNPASGPFSISLSAPRAGTARIELLDIGGRIAASELRAVEAGTQRLFFGAAPELAPGIYTLRVTLGDRRVSRRLSYVR